MLFFAAMTEQCKTLSTNLYRDFKRVSVIMHHQVAKFHLNRTDEENEHDVLNFSCAFRSTHADA